MENILYCDAKYQSVVSDRKAAHNIAPVDCGVCPIGALAVVRIRAGLGERALWLAQCTRDPCRRALHQSSF